MQEAQNLGKLKFLERHGKTNPSLSKLIINRIELEKKAKEKIPALYNAGGFFDRRSLEQCTSEDVAEFKAQLFNGENVLVLAGGLGVDDMAFSKSFKHVISIEQNIELNDISRFNYKQLGLSNIERHNATAESFLKAITTPFDLIYIDPDRRSEEKRQILLSEHSPNVIELLPTLFEKTDTVAIKISPLFDQSMALKELGQVSELIAISRYGEMKELLIVCRKHQVSEPIIKCVDISDQIVVETFDNKNVPFNHASNLNLPYFYEAGASLVKMRTSQAYAQRMGLHPIDIKVPYFTGHRVLKKFLGRQFELVSVMPYSIKLLRNYLKDKGIDQLNLKIRGLDFSTADVSKSLKQKDGGDDYIFVLPHQADILMFHCKKIRH